MNRTSTAPTSNPKKKAKVNTTTAVTDTASAETTIVDDNTDDEESDDNDDSKDDRADVAIPEGYVRVGRFGLMSAGAVAQVKRCRNRWAKTIRENRIPTSAMDGRGGDHMCGDDAEMYFMIERVIEPELYRLHNTVASLNDRKFDADKAMPMLEGTAKWMSIHDEILMVDDGDRWTLLMQLYYQCVLLILDKVRGLGLLTPQRFPQLETTLRNIFDHANTINGIAEPITDLPHIVSEWVKESIPIENWSKYHPKVSVTSNGVDDYASDTTTSNRTNLVDDLYDRYDRAYQLNDGRGLPTTLCLPGDSGRVIDRSVTQYWTNWKPRGSKNLAPKKNSRTFTIGKTHARKSDTQGNIRRRKRKSTSDDDDDNDDDDDDDE